MVPTLWKPETSANFWFLSGALALAVASAIFGRHDLGALAAPPHPRVEQTLTPVLKPELKPTDQPGVRRMVPVKLHLENSFKGTLNSRPGKLAVTAEHHLVVLDLNESTVKEFTQTGELIHRFSTGQEDYPAQIIDFALSPDHMVWVVDPIGNIEGLQQNQAKPIHLDGLHAYRITWIGDHLLVETVPSAALPFGDKLFLTVNTQGKVMNRFGEIVVNNAQNGLATLGELAPMPQQKFAFAPTGPGLMAVYDAAGSLTVLTKTVNPAPMPHLAILKSGATKLMDVAATATTDVAVSGSYIFMLSQLPAPASTSVVDLYDQRTGEYRHSFVLPSLSKVLSVDGQTIYTASGTTISRWAAESAW